MDQQTGRALCRGCGAPIHIANVLMMTERLLIWECECEGGRQGTAGELDDGVIAAIFGTLQPRLPYTAAHLKLPLYTARFDAEMDTATKAFRRRLASVTGPDVFEARCKKAERPSSGPKTAER